VADRATTGGSVSMQEGPMSKVRILIADDHPVVRRGLRSILHSQPGWEVSGEATTGREAVALAAQLKPDVVIMDVSMPELNGVEATRQIVAQGAGTEVLILTMHRSEEIAREVLRAGARAVVLKSDADEALISAVNALRQHKPYLTSRVTEFMLDRYLNGSAERADLPASQLTGREREVLQLVSEGKSNKEVAAALNITVKTAEAHRANLMRKLNLRSVSDLVRYAVRNKIVEA
jgi:DNA-binding NarL/FixJ family response regulator